MLQVLFNYWVRLDFVCVVYYQIECDFDRRLLHNDPDMPEVRKSTHETRGLFKGMLENTPGLVGFFYSAPPKMPTRQNKEALKFGDIE